MNRLWVQLTLAFGAITLMVVLMVALLANRQVDTQFRSFMAWAGIQESELIDQLAAYYNEQGDWNGVEQLLNTIHGPSMSMGQGTGQGRRRGGPGLLLADATGQFVYTSNPGTSNQALASRQELQHALPIEAQGEVVGYLLIQSPGAIRLTPAAQMFLVQVNQSLLQAGVLAGGLGFVVGLVLARSLTAPLSRLTHAADQIAQGNLAQRASITQPHEMARLSESFNHMATSLQQASQQRQRLVADIAHELRTPLSVVQGNLQAMLDDVYPLEKSEVAVIYDETLMLKRLVDDLYQLARAEAGQLQLTVHPCQIIPLITETAALFQDEAQEKQITLDVGVPDHLPTISADPDRLRQVLHNLLVNALRYTPVHGQIQLQVEQPSHDAIRITVSDTGPGIADEHLSRVFERFWRVEESRSRDHGGSGLGLAIAKQLVAAHGGQMGVTSVVGQGSTFWFTL
ncbi:MAG: hypothetical protein GFH27_549361n1, partial [Chloroflexi bacterium AL-W]|nr:hypothetical protein [Chloroflexi bacterium AL-N1]NOK70713.1 hypothetical protein [Chloroflexi bacterium AL-N10]NOK85616.1 hypothetical protein [Chloroflexi bacterium AL-W]NOK92530.1 hypothetical protein [Chloroflexi bacterium AL-N15]